MITRQNRNRSERLSARKPREARRGVVRRIALLLALALTVQAAGFAWAQSARPRNGQAEPAAASAVDPATDEGTSAVGEAIPSKNLLEIMRAGGLLMWPLLLCSVITVVFLFERLIALRRSRVIPGPFVKRFLHQLRDGMLDKEQALELCARHPSTVATVFAAAVKKWGRPAVEIEQAILDSGERAVNELRRYVRVFNGVSTISPLLGLLGTVFGMIKAFNDIALSNAMGKPELLAAGISEALITTAAGLTIAIPALAIYLYFVGRVDALIIEIDAAGQEVVGVISAEALQETSPSPRTRTARREPAA